MLLPADKSELRMACPVSDRCEPRSVPFLPSGPLRVWVVDLSLRLKFLVHLSYCSLGTNHLPPSMHQEMSQEVANPGNVPHADDSDLF